MRTRVLAAGLGALVVLGCGAPAEQPVAPAATDLPTTLPQQPTTTAAATTSTAPLGPDVEFRAAGRTLLVRPSTRRRPAAELGAELPVPSDIQVEIRAPGAEAVVAFVVPREVWETDTTGEALELSPAGQPGRWIWTASVAPAQYVIEATFTISGAPLAVRAPVRVG